MTAVRALALGCLALALEACTGSVGDNHADSGAPSPGGAAGTSLDPGEGGVGGVAGTEGAAGMSGSSGGAGLGGVAGAVATGTAGTPGAGGSAGGAGTTAGAGRGGSSGGAGTTGAAGRGGGGNAGSGGNGGNGGSVAPTGDPPGYVPALVGVGYGGIRVVSRDGGKTWGDRSYETTNGGDDDVLLRAVAYGNGLWVATGWKLWTSTDGVKWTDHGKLKDGPVKSCAIIEGLAFKDGTFFGVCDGNIFRSTDGLTWTKVSTIPNTGSHVYLNYRGGKLVAYGDTMTSYQSDDALTWTVMSGIQQATYCENTWKSQTDCKDSSWFDGAYLRADWQGKISRSTDGKSFATVYNDDQRNTLYQSRAIAAGFVAPK
jgi:hypothetical protein